MKVFTAEQVEDRAKYLDREQRHESAAMLRELAKRIRQDADDSRRDPVTDPLSGDRAADPGAEFLFVDETNVYVTGNKCVWRAWAAREGITFARRGEFTK